MSITRVSDLLKQNNESNTQTSMKSTMVGKEKVMSYEDIVDVQKKRDEKATAVAGWRGRKRKNFAFVPVPKSKKKPRAAEIAEATEEFKALGIESFCSVFCFYTGSELH